MEPAIRVGIVLKQGIVAVKNHVGIILQMKGHASGLSKERIAHAASLSTSTYRKLEKGESNPGTPANPRLRTLIALAEVLEIDLRELRPGKKPKIAVGR